MLVAGFVLASLMVSAEVQPVDFDTQVLPVLTKAGCNAAACHGAADGRGGFKLSLFGGDPAADYDAMVHEFEGRRINVASPSDSLVVAKPSGTVDHEGGQRLEADGPDVDLLLAWIGRGARRESARRLVKLQVEPEQARVSQVPATVPVRVEAWFDDGSRRDVTQHTVMTPADESAVEVVGAEGLRLLRPGQQVVVLRYLSMVRTVQLIAPLSVQSSEEGQSDEANRNWIDAEVAERLQLLGLPASPRADPPTLLRRVTLDLTGRMPTAEQVERYLADDDPLRYERLVDRLLSGNEFTQYWTLRLCRLLRVRSQPQDVEGAAAFYRWLSDQVGGSASWSKIASELLTSEGDTHHNGPANFHRFSTGPRDQAEYVSEVLLGVRLRCANCHNHPLDRWTQDDYHGLAAIFARIERGRIVRLMPRGEVEHPRTESPAVPRIPGERFLDPAADGRVELDKWLTDSDNSYLARAMVNRLWKALMGRGLVEPTDDLRDTNPATHPRLLDRLADEFARDNFELRPLLRQIALSAAYRRSSRPLPGNATDDRFYSHALVRPLPAEVLADAIADFTRVPEPYADKPPGTRAIQIFDGRGEAPTLDILGRCEVAAPCESPAVAGGLSLRLHLMNGPLVNARLVAHNGRLREWLQLGWDNARIVHQSYLLALGRTPTGEEAEFWSDRLAGQDSDSTRRQLLEDFLWSLLNCREFVTNH